MDTKILHVVQTDQWGPLTDVHACLASLSRRSKISKVVTLKDFWNARSWWLAEPKLLIAVWNGGLSLGPNEITARIAAEPRRATLALVWTESYDQDKSKLLPSHRVFWDDFVKLAPKFDCVLAHTPNMSRWIEEDVKIPTFVMPVGWDAEAMGCPRVVPEILPRAICWGTMAGRRTRIVPELRIRLGPRFAAYEKLYGRQLLGLLDTHACALYVGHSAIQSYSTWRLWQSASTGCALISEPGDTWPFEAEKHFIQIPMLTEDNIASVCDQLRAMIEQREWLADFANEAHKQARRYTMEFIEETCVRHAYDLLFGSRM